MRIAIGAIWLNPLDRPCDWEIPDSICEQYASDGGYLVPPAAAYSILRMLSRHKHKERIRRTLRAYDARLGYFKQIDLTMQRGWHT